MDRIDIRIIIGRNIRHRRLLSGLTQKATANHLGITLKRFQKYETGTGSISCDEAEKLALFFYCSINDLCREATEDVPYVPEHPWNPYKVHALISHFNRIRSHAVRNKVCGMVHIIADIVSSDIQETM